MNNSINPSIIQDTPTTPQDPLTDTNHTRSWEEATHLEDSRTGDMQDPGCLAEASNQQHDTPPPPPFEIETLSDLARLRDLKLGMEFIQALDIAALDDEYSRLDSDSIKRLRNPPTSRPHTSDPDFRLGLDLFLTSIKFSQDTYNMSRDAVLRRHPR